MCWALSTAAVGASYRFCYEDGIKGTGFGILALVGAVGGTAGGVVATIMAGQEFWGIPGWRCAFIMMAVFSSLIGFFVFMFGIDPRELHKDLTLETAEASEMTNLVETGYASVPSVWSESWRAMKTVTKVQTFQFIIMQGVVGSLPWTAIVFFTMWFELIGFDHRKTAALISLFTIRTSMGNLLDLAFVGVPFSWFLLNVIPQSVSSCWCATGANNPIFPEVVPLKHRTMIYAFDRAFEGSFSSFLNFYNTYQYIIKKYIISLFLRYNHYAFVGVHDASFYSLRTKKTYGPKYFY
ncbi:hypothetical protein MKX01_005741 [Papaver californicum]|nr:hypothetical protein MKX01_005741 [Papaver californicum]